MIVFIFFFHFSFPWLHFTFCQCWWHEHGVQYSYFFFFMIRKHKTPKCRQHCIGREGLRNSLDTFQGPYKEGYKIYAFISISSLVFTMLQTQTAFPRIFWLTFRFHEGSTRCSNQYKVAHVILDEHLSDLHNICISRYLDRIKTGRRKIYQSKIISI